MMEPRFAKTSMAIFFLAVAAICQAASCLAPERALAEDGLGSIAGSRLASGKDGSRNRFLHALPQRIVSLAPSVTELLFALDCGHLMAGRSTYSSTPQEAMRLPDVGPYNRPSLESIIALRPDLCIALSDGTPEPLLRQLRSLGIEVIELTISSFDDLEASIITLGHALHREEKAKLEIENMRNRLETLHSRIVSLGASGMSVLFQLQENPLIAAGPSSFAGQLIEKAGAVNAAGNNSMPYPILGMENIHFMSPDVIIIAGMGNAEDDKRSASSWKRWKTIPAVRKGRVYVVDSDLFTRPSLRAVDALEELIRILYADRQEACTK